MHTCTHARTHTHTHTHTSSHCPWPYGLSTLNLCITPKCTTVTTQVLILVTLPEMYVPDWKHCPERTPQHELCPGKPYPSTDRFSRGREGGKEKVNENFFYNFRIHIINHKSNANRLFINFQTHIYGALVVGESLVRQNEHSVFVVGLGKARDALRALPQSANLHAGLAATPATLQDT